MLYRITKNAETKIARFATIQAANNRNFRHMILALDGPTEWWTLGDRGGCATEPGI